MSDGITPVLKSVISNLKSPHAARVAGDMAAGFIQKHISEGEGFTPLAPATIEYRGQGHPLQDTGTLLRSIKTEQTGPDKATVFTELKYAPLQNEGGTITAKKNWLFIPAAGTRKLERRYGYSPKEVLDGLRAAGFWVFRVGRTVCYRQKGKKRLHVAYYLKKSVTVPARKFFYISNGELEMISQEVGDVIVSGA
ncbi:MAG: hypothetical protein IJQ27_04195 [Spirochaetia bacterium]|nr:hypothetical protein [Spirochaetia bacterium]